MRHQPTAGGRMSRSEKRASPSSPGSSGSNTVTDTMTQLMPRLLFCFLFLFMTCYALPPFEIRSASRQASEGASRWENHLVKVNRCKQNHGILCPSSASDYNAVCLSTIQVCDGVIDCPNGEEENLTLCSLLRHRESALRSELRKRRSSKR